MIPPSRSAHYVPENKITRLPRRWVVFDTEATQTAQGGHKSQYWGCGVAAYINHEKGIKREPEYKDYADPAKLWGDITLYARAKTRTIVVAHNVGYDLRISAAFDVLPALGWKLEAANMARRGAWFRWSRNGATLVCVDSMSVFNCSLEKMATDMGMKKKPLPHWGDSREKWLARCKVDVEILVAAWLAYLDWIETADLGCWQYTGSAQAWSTWRHRFLTDKVLVHGDEEAIAAERRAAWTGRCEVWRHGDFKKQRIYEYDLERAYARIAASEQVPVKLTYQTGPLTIQQYHSAASRYRVLAEVELKVQTPCVPAEHERRIVWPLGSFRTTLWDCEIDLALKDFAEVKILRTWNYRKAPALQAWGKWVERSLSVGNEELPMILRRVVKHWSRALIGRFGLRYQTWEPFGEVGYSDVWLSRAKPRADGTPDGLLQVGRSMFRLTGKQEAKNSVPAITSYIMACCRVRLWEITQAVGVPFILYVDTDGFLTNEKGRKRIEAMQLDPVLSGLRLKETYRGASIRAPRSIVLENVNRIAGVPSKGHELSNGLIRGEVWYSLSHSLHAGEVGTVTIRERDFRIPDVDNRREHLADGETAPIFLSLNDETPRREKQGVPRIVSA